MKKSMAYLEKKNAIAVLSGWKFAYFLICCLVWLQFQTLSDLKTKEEIMFQILKKKNNPESTQLKNNEEKEKSLTFTLFRKGITFLYKWSIYFSQMHFNNIDVVKCFKAQYS